MKYLLSGLIIVAAVSMIIFSGNKYAFFIYPFYLAILFIIFKLFEGKRNEPIN